MNNSLKQFCYALVIMLGTITYGTIMCYPSPTGKEIRSVHHLAEDSFKWSFYNAISSLFAISGHFITSLLLHLLSNSRKKVVFTGTCLGTAIWLLNCLIKINIWAGIAIRALLGVIMGIFSSISSMYLIEIAPKGRKGTFACLGQIGFVIGLILFDFLGPSLSYMQLNYVGAAICALQASLIWLIEESPQVANINIIEKLQSNQPHKKFDYKLLCKKDNVIGIIFGVLMMLFQQFCGINAILTNLADLLSKSGLNIDGNYQAGISSCSQIISIFIGVFILDKIGKKITWIISCAMIVAFLLVFALCIKYDLSNSLPLICIFLYQLGFGLGVDLIPWFVIPEYFNDDARSPAMMIIVSSYWIFAFIIILLWPAMKKSMGLFGLLLFYMFIAVTAIVFGIFNISEPTQYENFDKDEQKKDGEEETSDEIDPEAL